MSYSIFRVKGITNTGAFKGLCKHDKEKAQHKAIPVIKPVGLLKSVPDKIEGADEKAHYEKHYECR